MRVFRLLPLVGLTMLLVASSTIIASGDEEGADAKKAEPKKKAIPAQPIKPAGKPDPAKPERTTSTLKAVVTDTEGNPMAGVEVASGWEYKEGDWVPTLPQVTDENGVLKLEVTVWSAYPNLTYTLFAVSSDGTLGGTLVYNAANVEEEHKIELKTMVTVRGSARYGDTGEPLESTSYITETATKARIGRTGIVGGEFSLRVPPGEYSVTFSGGAKYGRTASKFVASPDVKEMVLNDVELPLSKIGEMMATGQAAEWHCTDARNLPGDLAAKGADIKLADFRGKWVIMEFWGFW